MTVERGYMERRIGVLIDGVDAGAMLEKRFGAGVATMDRRQMERRPTIQRHRIHLRTFLQQKLQAFATVS